MRRYLVLLLVFFSVLFPVFSDASASIDEDLSLIRNLSDDSHSKLIPAGYRALSDMSVWKSSDGITRVHEEIRIIDSANEALQTSGDINNTEAELLSAESEEDEDVLEEIKENKYSRQGLSIGIDAHMLFVRMNADKAYGATLNAGLGFEHFMGNIYVRADYFTKPLGSASGSVADREYSIEGGATISYAAPLGHWFAVKAGADIGYFAQFYERPEFDNLLILGFHGLIGRPYLSADVSIGKFDIEVGVFCQAAFSTKFRSYDGYGFFVRIY